MKKQDLFGTKGSCFLYALSVAVEDAVASAGLFDPVERFVRMGEKRLGVRLLCAEGDADAERDDRQLVLRVRELTVDAVDLFADQLALVTLHVEHEHHEFVAAEAAYAVLGADKIYLEAQDYARAFYEKLGFRPISETFVEDGIPHVKMLLD